MAGLINGSIKPFVSLVLDRFLKPYVENFDSRKLDLGIFSGSIMLKNLNIKKGALDNFRLPVDVVEGHLGELQMKIPWTSLGSTPVEVIVEDLYLLVIPGAESKVDIEEDERRAQAAKQERLASAELLQSRGNMDVSPEESTKQQGFMQALITKVTNNVQVTVKNIHVRYEDTLSCPGHPFSAGITLAGFSAHTTDGNWEKTFLQSSVDAVHKLAKLESLAVYFNTDEEGLLGKPREETMAQFKNLIAHGSHVPPHQYILRPVTGQGRIIINHKIDDHTPRYDAQLLFDELGFIFDDHQYRDVISMIDMYHFYIRQAQYRKYRPPQGEIDKSPKLALMRFAGDTILREVHEKNQKWTWGYFKERRDDRKRYVELYKNKLSVPTPPVNEVNELAALETKLAYEDIRFYRSIARSEIRKDRASRKRLEEQKQKEAAQQQTSRGWLSWGWGGGANAKGAADAPKDEGMSEEQRKELYEVIDYDEKKAMAESFQDSPEALKMRATTSLNKGFFKLRTDPHANDGEGVEVVSLMFNAFRAEFLQRSENLDGTVTLGGLGVYDGTSPGSLYHQIVRVKDEPTSTESKGASSGDSSAALSNIEPGGDSGESKERSAVDALFYVHFEQNPLDGRADSAIEIRLKALEIIWNKGYVEAIYNFFRPPESQLESVGALVEAATATLGELREQTRAGLEYALQTHKTVDLKLDMKSPIIIIPEDVRTKQGHHMVLDAGHISIKSDLVPKSTLREIQAKKNRRYNDEDLVHLQSLMYDRFFLNLESAQLLIGNDLDSCMAALLPENEGHELHLVDRINMQFAVKRSIIPEDPNLAKFVVSGKLPTLKVNLSNGKYKGMMRLVDLSIPKFGDDDVNIAKPTIPNINPTALKLQSNVFKRTAEYNLDEQDDVTTTTATTPTEDDEGDSQNSDDDAETFVDAEGSNREDEKSREIHQHNFEFSFEVDKLQTSLFKSTGIGPDKLLADTVLERFVLTFIQDKYTMKVNIALRSVSLEMIDGPTERTRLIESFITGQDAAKSSSDTDLVKVKYSRVQKESPEYMSVYDGIDQSVDVDLSTFVVSAAPEPILTLYDFLMSTFVSGPAGNNPSNPAPHDSDSKNPAPAQAPPPTDTGKIRVRVKLTSIQLRLVNNANSIATLALSAADVALLLRANTLRVGARLGNLTITDDSPTSTLDPSFKQIVSIEGKELADFSYETFDPNDAKTFPGVNSSVYLRVGSLKVNFLEEPIRDVYHFLIKFARMKSLYDAATQAAVQRASEIQRMKFDVQVSSPILICPKDPTRSLDVLVMKLGEIVASNEYGGQVMKLKAGLRGIRLTSHLHIENEKTKLKIIDDVEINADITQTSGINRAEDQMRPDMEVKVSMSDIKISLTQLQFGLLMEFVRSIPRVLSAAPEAEDEAGASVGTGATPERTPDPRSTTGTPAVDLGPELITSRNKPDLKATPWNTLDLVFAINSVRAQLYDKRATTQEQFKTFGIARFSLNNTTLRYKSLSDGSAQAEVVLKSFTVFNTRPGDSKFREIIPAARHDRNQFMALYTTTGGDAPSSSVVASVDSPKIILAMEPVFALVEFASAATSPPENSGNAEEPRQVQGAGEIRSSGDTINEIAPFSARLDLHDVSIAVLENEENASTQAIEVKIEDILVSQQGILAVSANRAGIFLMQMNKPTDRVSFMDELDVTLSMDTRHPEGHSMHSIEVTCQTIVFRASQRDYALFSSIIQNAMARMSQPSDASTSSNSAQNASIATSSKAPRSTNIPPSRQSGRATKSRRLSTDPATVIMTKEKCVAKFDGLRLVLIGEMHEQPLLHLKFDPFTFACKDWSGELQASTGLVLDITYWNIANSHWEPLIDPWKMSLLAGKDDHTGALALTLASDERLDINVTTTFIEHAITTINVWSKESEFALQRARGGDAPYRLFNKTGIPVQIWSDADEKSDGEVPQSVTLDDGESRDWRFDDWKSLRQHETVSRRNSIAIKFEGKPWEQVRHIPVDREGEFVYALRPRIRKVSDRLLCEVLVKDNVKHVTLRSTYKVENNTLYNMDISLINRKTKAWFSRTLAPGQDYCLPIEIVLENNIKFKPDAGFGYAWSDRSFSWEELLQYPSNSVTCPHRSGAAEEPFHLQLWTDRDANDPINNSYPRMTLRLRPPMELENLLPHDISYTFYNKQSQKHWSSFLRKGGLMPVHCVELDQLVMLNVEVQDTDLKRSDWAIVNEADDPEFSPESTLRLVDKSNRFFDLHVNYVRFANTGGTFRVQLYSPFVMINKTGLPINVRAGVSRDVAGQSNSDLLSECTPFMFSHSKTQGADFSFRVNNSAWSKPVNFEAPSADADLSMASKQSNKDTCVGLSWAPGLGKYKLTKVITIAPRFIVRNQLGGPLLVREYGSTIETEVAIGKDASLFDLQRGRTPALSLKYPGISSEWSSSINLQDIGAIHVRLFKGQSQKPDLAKVEVTIEGSTIWAVVKKETGPWPFIIENNSDYTVSFCQTDERRPNTPPPTYTAQPHSREPYAWDSPAAVDKRLSLRVHNQKREVDIMEIGDLVPFKFQTSQGSRILSLDVRADGQTQILSISNYREDKSLYKRRPRSSSGTLSRQNTINSQAETFEAVTEEISPNFSVNIDLEGIGISLMNKRLVEVVYLTVLKLKMEYTDSEVARAVNAVIGWIQLDNQLHEAIYPIVLQPEVVKAGGNGVDVLPAVQASVIVLKDNAHGVTFIKYASVLLQAMQIQADEDFIFAVLDLTKLKGASWESNHVDAFTEYPTALPEPKGIQPGQDLYFEVLELQPMRLELSFMRTERVNADEKLTVRNPLAVALNALTMTLGNINDAPIRLNALAIKDMRLTNADLVNRVMYHYKQEFLRQLYRVLGSADFIGNPVGLFTNVSSGVADIFYEPYKGVVMHGSKELGIGIAKGAASFAKKTVFGLTDSMTKVTGSIGKGLSAATFDPEYQRQRRLTQRQNKPRHAIYGVTAGVEALGNSVLSGIEGVAMKPIQGAETGGPLGFFKGVGKGLVGVVTKPAVGIFDLASNITEGIRNTTTVFDHDQRNRKRIPRHTPADGILTTYSQREAVGQTWMKDLEQGAYRQEHYVAHYALPNSDDTVMLTTTRVICFSPTRLRVKWDLSFKHIERVAILDTGIRFADKAGREHDHFVPIPAVDSKTWFFQEVEKVINQWNANRRLER